MYGPGGHLGDQDATSNLLFPLPKEAPHKNGFDRPSDFGKEHIGNCGLQTTEHRYTLSWEVMGRSVNI